MAKKCIMNFFNHFLNYIFLRLNQPLSKWLLKVMTHIILLLLYYSHKKICSLLSDDGGKHNTDTRGKGGATLKNFLINTISHQHRLRCARSQFGYVLRCQVGQLKLAFTRENVKQHEILLRTSLAEYIGLGKQQHAGHSQTPWWTTRKSQWKGHTSQPLTIV